MRLAALGLILLASGSARAAVDCEFSQPGQSYCPVEGAAPVGCPIHLFGFPSATALTATVTRNGVQVDVTGTTTVVSVVESVASIDINTCNCEAITLSETFDETTMDLVGVQAGEVVSVADGGRTIEAAAPCPTIEWPETFHNDIACDLCPLPDAAGSDPPASPSHSGCSTGGAPSLLVALAMLLLPRRRCA
jgi:hypothetical protein